MVFEPLTNHIEMGLGSPTEMVARVENKQYYRELFQAAYGSPEVTIGKIGDALGGFVAGLISNQSPFESAMSTPNGISFLPDDVLSGFNLFVAKYDCIGCHDVISSIGYSEAMGEEFVNIGLDLQVNDQGRAGVTGLTSDIGKFKIPNLRNVALTAPYMHDGRFNTLEEVLDHYSHSVQPHPNLDPRLQGLSGDPLIRNITDQDRHDFLKFLNALTDQEFISNPAFSDPFSE